MEGRREGFHFFLFGFGPPSFPPSPWAPLIWLCVWVTHSHTYW